MNAIHAYVGVGGKRSTEMSWRRLLSIQAVGTPLLCLSGAPTIHARDKWVQVSIQHRILFDVCQANKNKRSLAHFPCPDCCPCMLVWFTTNPALVHPLASRRPHLSIFFVVVIFGGLEFLPQHLELRLCVQLR